MCKWKNNQISYNLNMRDIFHMVKKNEFGNIKKWL